MKRSLGPFTWMCLAFCTLAGCGEEGGDVRGNLGEAAGVDRASLYAHGGTPFWPGGNVRVCWETGPATDGSGDPQPARAHPNFAVLSRLIRDAVDNGWGRAAKIVFWDWGDCPARSPSGNAGRVAIHWETIAAAADIGYHADSWTRMRLNPEDLTGPGAGEAFFRGVALHEFGHALGFDHEFLRPDDPTPAGVECARAPGGDRGAYYGTPFDRDSIMTFTYCGILVSPPHPGVLSPWDIVGVQNAYGRKVPGSLAGEANRCLDIPLPYGGFGTRLQVFGCNGGVNQTFRRTPDLQLFAPGGSFSPVPSDAFLDAPLGSFANGTPVQTWSRNTPVTANQQWRFDNVLIRGIGNKCLEVSNFDYRAGAPIGLWDCHGLSNQRWQVTPSGEIRSRGGDGGWCLDVPSAEAVSGRSLQLFRCHGGAAQQFHFNNLGEIQFRGLCTDVRGGGVGNGSVIQLYGCAGGVPNQQWHLRGPVTGAAGKCLDISGGSGPSWRMAAQLWNCHGGANQEWDYYFKE